MRFGNKINVKTAFSVLVICLVIIVLILFLYNHSYKFKLTNTISATIESVSILDAETAEEYYAEQYNSTNKTKKVYENNQQYYAIECNFYVDYSENEDAIVSKAVAVSDRFDLIYNDRKYNICESPISMKEGNVYHYTLLLFIKKDGSTEQLSQNEFMQSLSESLNIYLK